jgi:hypothetical protein
MKNAGFVAGLFVCLTVVLVAAHQGDAGAASAAQDVAAADIFVPEAQTFAKKCSFNSDCPYGKCSKGKCGACSFNSDCKGWGKCSKGQCGACSFNSDCKGFGGCSSGRCKKSPY